MRNLAHPINHAHLVQRAHVGRQTAVNTKHAAIDDRLAQMGRSKREDESTINVICNGPVQECQTRIVCKARVQKQSG